MRSYIAPYVQSFLPLFVAINPMGIIPIYLSVTENLPPAVRRRLTLQAMLTAVGLSVLILFAGQLIFSLLGITVNDLRVGGGLILLVLSISNLIFGDYRRRDPTEGAEGEDLASVGIVPASASLPPLPALLGDDPSGGNGSPGLLYKAASPLGVLRAGSLRQGSRLHVGISLFLLITEINLCWRLC